MAKRGKHKHKGRAPGQMPVATPAAAPEVSPAEQDTLDSAGEEAASSVVSVAMSADPAVETPAPAAAADAGVEGSGVVVTPVARQVDARLLSPFLLLADYEARSLVHVVGLPEQLDAPGLWRGVAYRIGRHRLASGFDEVVEILPMPALTHVPGAQPWLLGVANIRGSLLPVVDLKQFLEGERTVLHERQRVLVVRQQGGDVAVTIDELYGQRSFVEAQAIDASALAQGRYAHFILRVYRMNDQDWAVFSLDRLTRTPEFRQAAA